MNTLLEIYPHYDPRCKEVIEQVIHLDRRNIINFVVVRGEMGKEWLPYIIAQMFVKENWN